LPSQAPSADVIRAALTSLLDTGSLPRRALLQPVQSLIKREIIDAIVEEDYDLAARLNSAAEIVNHLLEELRDGEKSMNSRVSVEGHLESLRSALALESQEWDRIRQTYIRDQTALRDALVKRHRQERATCEEKWTDSSYSVPERGTSPEVLRLRQLEQDLVLGRRFLDAREVKQQADALEAKELELAEEGAKEGLRKKVQALVAKHEREMELFEGHRERGFQYMIVEEERMYRRYGRMIRAAEGELNAPERKPSKLEQRLEKKDRPSSEARSRLRALDQNPLLNLNGLVLKRYCRAKREGTSYSITSHKHI
jgi:hypothetical protein